MRETEIVTILMVATIIYTFPVSLISHGTFSTVLSFNRTWNKLTTMLTIITIVIIIIMWSIKNYSSEYSNTHHPTEFNIISLKVNHFNI